MAEPTPIAESLATLRTLGDWVEVVDAAAAALWVCTEEDKPVPGPWAEADNEVATECRTVARKVIEAAAPHLERQIREKVAQEIEASIVDDEARYGSCTCADGKECHPHACHRLLNTVTADEDTWPVHIKVGAWKALDPEIRRDAAAIARGDIAAADETTGDGHG